MLRGIERSRIFRDDSDRQNLASRLERVFTECDAHCFAAAFMPNHVHLVVRSGRTRLSEVMARIGTGYALGFNKRHDRVGHLFQNRFKSVPIDSDSQLLATIRYVHLNPVRADIVSDLRELERYEWTGHAHLMRGSGPLAIDSAEVLALFGDRSAAAREHLRRFMTLPPGGEGLSDTAAGIPAALDSLLTTISAAFAVSRRDVVEGSRRRDVSRARAALSHIACDQLGLSRVEVARALGVTETAVRSARSRGIRLLQESHWLRTLPVDVRPTAKTVPKVRVS